MKKRWWVVISVAIIALAALLVLGIRKGKSLLPGRLTSAVSSSRLLAQAKELEAKGMLLDAKAAYQRLISEFSNSAEVVNWQKKVEGINIKLLFSSVPVPQGTLYEIKPGDTLAKIAQQFNTTADLIMRSNKLSDTRILPGRKIRVWKAPFSILVDKSQNILILKSEEEVFKTYIVSTGKNNSTPVGNFKITAKLPNPTWFKKSGAPVPAGSSENILGTRWLGFNLPQYGIHGTTDPASLGRQVTEGCVRMSNPDVEELYAIIPLGTEVTIVD